MDVDCRESMEAVTECVRRGERPPDALQAHLRECARCREQWAAQESLAAPMRRLREAVAEERSPAFRRRQLLAEFEMERRAGRPAWPLWAWSVAAAVLLAVLLVRPAHLPPAAGTPQAAEEFAGASFPDVSEGGEFTPVAFSEPLAAGESIRVVREELDGAELAALGIDAPDAFGSSVDADVVLGGDGLPRAVRLLGYDLF
jgi:hypothetical protein